MRAKPVLARLVFVLALALSAISCGDRASKPKTLLVSAAADLTPAFKELGSVFERRTGTPVVFNFGSTGQLTQQIEQGAPADLFAAANSSFIEQLEREEMIVPGSAQVYARGRLTIWTPRTATLAPITRIEDLSRDDITRVAIANPEHAPYGMAAKEALESAGVWERIAPKLVYGENIRQTLQFAESGNVDVAIVALSLSIQSDGNWTLVPAELHKPLNQTLAIVKSTRNLSSAQAFVALITSPEGREIMRRYGFTSPDELARTESR